MKKRVSDWGNRRIEEISESFYKRYSTNADASHEAWLAESQLEAWKMRTRLELLEELRREASGWHSKKMQQLRRLQAPGGKKGQSQNGAAAVAEAFLSLKARIHKSLQGIITAEVADHSLSRLGQVNSWHQAHGELIQEQQDSAQGDGWTCGVGSIPVWLSAGRSCARAGAAMPRGPAISSAEAGACGACRGRHIHGGALQSHKCWPRRFGAYS
ncbi:unnamed protein product [Cladocopium goreaui]|uniref:Uncharacterized protein n=1 Tax=Cladocopium goreaui TaxID=2562237 RepID=A0A9P1CAP9_9DINO|nr:unnamed protein product [Cladocopium goreaui]